MIGKYLTGSLFITTVIFLQLTGGIFYITSGQVGKGILIILYGLANIVAFFFVG